MMEMGAVSKNGGGLSITTGLSALAFLVFVVFVCYALSVSNTTEVHDACGAQLWKLILAHLVVPIGLSLGIVVGTVAVIVCAFGFSEMGESNLPIVAGVLTSLVMLMYCSLFLGLGYPIVRDAMYSDTCVQALSSVSFTHTPLLGIMGCIYLVFDAIVLGLLVLGVLLWAGIWACGSDKQNKPPEMELTPFLQQEEEDVSKTRMM
jgi:hypothetical protein